MRNRIAAALAAATLCGAGLLSAQPGAPAPAPAPTPAPAPAPEEPAPKQDIADVTVSSEKRAKMSPREMAQSADAMLSEMETFHKEALEDQAQAKKAKDVIKLNCVNENLLAVKQLLNIAESAENDLTEAIANGSGDEQVHSYGKIVIARDNAETARTDSRNCIGEELQFIGKNDITVDGPAIPYDPTQDSDVGSPTGSDPFDLDVPLEDPAFASPFSPQ